jgi:hypothetical protein
MGARASSSDFDEPMLVCDAGTFQFTAAVDATGAVIGVPVFARSFDGR